MTDYWNERFKAGKVWGSKPSGTANIASDYFTQKGKKSVLVVGSGYGRNANFFYEHGFDVEGIEYAKDAIAIAQQDNPAITYYEGSIFDIPCGDKRYSAIYCYNVIHLFMQHEREELLTICGNLLEQEGILFMTAFSDEDSDYGMGRMTEKNTFEKKAGKPVHYYAYDEFRDAFSGYSIIKAGEYKEPVGDKVCQLRYVIAMR